MARPKVSLPQGGKPLWLASALVLGLIAWFASGALFNGDDAPAPARPATAQPVPLPTVAVVRSEARPVTRFITSQGEVTPDREVPVRAKTTGTVVELPVAKGARVEAGQLLVRLDMEDRQARLDRAQAELEQRLQDNQAASNLADKGYTAETRRREAFAQLQAARAEVAAIRQEIDHVTIEAPFAGILDRLDVEIGEYVSIEAEVARIVDNDPLVVQTRIPQHSIAAVRIGAPAEIVLVTGQTLEGTVHYISAGADRSTRTFLVEIEVPNPDGVLPSGISAEVRIPTDEVDAHFVSPAILSLSTDGVLGVKAVDDDGVVQFHPVEMVRAGTDGIWIAGLPDRLRLITTGQGFVGPGERVQAVSAGPGEAEADGGHEG